MEVINVDGTRLVEQFIRVPGGALVEVTWVYSLGSNPGKGKFLLLLHDAVLDANTSVPVPDWLATQVPEDLIGGCVAAAFEIRDNIPIRVDVHSGTTVTAAEREHGLCS